MFNLNNRKINSFILPSWPIHKGKFAYIALNFSSFQSLDHEFKRKLSKEKLLNSILAAKFYCIVHNVWCIKFQSKYSSNTVLCLLRNLMHQTLWLLFIKTRHISFWFFSILTIQWKAEIILFEHERTFILIDMTHISYASHEQKVWHYLALPARSHFHISYEWI